MMWGFGWNWLSMTLMMLGSTLWIVLLVVLVWVMVRWLQKRIANPGQQTTTLPENSPTALAILHQRYARGEIDTTTFEEMRERLEGAPSTQQRSRNPAGEKLFDGITSGSDTL